jgi:two-component system NtrC family response regulator
MRILLADDDASLRRVLQFKLQKSGYEVAAVADGRQALDQLEREPFDLLLSDIRMPGLDGIELLEKARASRPDLKVVLMTAHATVLQAVQAVKLGAFDYITKPFEDDQLFRAIEQALAFGHLESENRRLRGQLDDRTAGKLLGVSQPFRAMMATVDKIAATDATVLLTGPSGVGKELVARSIHQRSTRAEGEFVAVNCAAIPRELIESELFGHVRGAFTGAVRDKKGKFELAERGTILLDEIADLAFELQAKLLRVLQERVVEPVGAERPRAIDVRVLGSTNVDLEQRVKLGTFREDLFYRLNVIPIRVPSLAQRPEDIPLLAREFIRRFAPDRPVALSPDLERRLADYSWPGNIRELENLIERMVILRRGDLLTPKDLPGNFGQAASPGEPVTLPHNNWPTLPEAEASLVREALARAGWNRSRAAKLLAIPRHVLIYRMKKYRIEPPPN